MKSSRIRFPKLFYVFAAVPITALVLAALPQHAAPQSQASEIVLSVDPGKSNIRWTLGSTLHTVHGTFAFKSGTLHLDPATGKAGGEISVLATSGNSENDSRDKKMHREVLESNRYPDIIFRPDHVDGRIAPQGPFQVQLHGIFILHGGEHELTVPVQAEFAKDHWTGSAKFSVPFIDWGLKNPSTFLLRVNHSVEIEMELDGNLRNPLTP